MVIYLGNKIFKNIYKRKILNCSILLCWRTRAACEIIQDVSVIFLRPFKRPRLNEYNFVGAHARVKGCSDTSVWTLKIL